MHMNFRKINKNRVLLFFIIILCFKLFSSQVNTDTSKIINYTGINPPYLNDSCLAWADSVMQKMNLNEKIGQLFMVSDYSNEQHKKDINTLIKKYKIGGIIFM